MFKNSEKSNVIKKKEDEHYKLSPLSFKKHWTKFQIFIYLHKSL